MKLLADLILNGAETMKMSENIKKNFNNPERNNGELRADKFKGFITDEWNVDGFNVITVSGKKTNGGHVIFLHGGGYVAEATASHRRIIEELVKMYGLKVTFIDYPLAPEHTYEKTHKIVMKAYREITIKNYGDEFYLFGDSAGGGLALAVLQILRDEKMIPFPKKTVLMSPWVDLTMSNPKIGEAAERDPLLTMDCLYHAAERYIGNGDAKNAVLSPTFGRMDNLGKIFLLTGTHEILNPDCRKLKTKLMAAYGTELEFYEGEKMVHDWILATPFYLEAFKAIEMVGEFYVNG